MAEFWEHILFIQNWKI